MGLFSKKTQPQTEPEVQTSDKKMLDALDVTRAQATKIYNTLDSIDFETLLAKKANQTAEVTEIVNALPTKIPAVDFINDVRKAVLYLKRELKNENTAELLKIESERLDGQIYSFAFHLKNALEKGDFDTVKCCLMGLNYGITQAHKPIFETDPTRKETEIANRESKIGVYKNIVAKSQDVFARKLQLDEFRKQYAKVFAEFGGVHEEMIREKHRRPDIFEKIKGMSTKDTKALTDEEMQAWNLTLKHNNLFNEANQVKVIGEHISILINQHERIISNLKTSAISIGYDIDDKLEQEIDKDLKTITQALSDDQEYILNAQAQLKKLQKEYEAAMGNSEMKAEIFGSVREIERIIQKMKEQEENEKAGAENLKHFEEEEALKTAAKIKNQNAQPADTHTEHKNNKTLISNY